MGRHTQIQQTDSTAGLDRGSPLSRIIHPSAITVITTYLLFGTFYFEVSVVGSAQFWEEEKQVTAGLEGPREGQQAGNRRAKARSWPPTDRRANCQRILAKQMLIVTR